MGHLNSFSASGGGNLNRNFPKIQMPGGLLGGGGGGVFKLRFDWYIKALGKFRQVTRLWNGDMKELKWRRTTSRWTKFRQQHVNLPKMRRGKVWNSDGGHRDPPTWASQGPNQTSLFHAFSWLGRSAINGGRKNRGEARREQALSFAFSQHPWSPFSPVFLLLFSRCPPILNAWKRVKSMHNSRHNAYQWVFKSGS